jgi:hypothetical protein
MLDIHFAYKLISCPCCCVMIWLTLSLYVCSNIRYVRILICCHRELLKSSLWSNSGRPLVTVIVWPLSLTVKYRKTSCNPQIRVYGDVTLYSSVQIPLLWTFYPNYGGSLFLHCWYLSTKPHCTTLQKTAIWVRCAPRIFHWGGGVSTLRL